MSRTAAYLAALASTAVPDLDPVSVRTVRSGSAVGFDVGFVVDAAQRRWTVRAPRTDADAARQDAVVTLLGSLADRVPFQVPTPRGFVAVPQGRAMVYPYLDGRPLLLSRVPPGPGLAADLGRAVGALHNVDRQVFDDAGVAAHDPESYREHHLAELDRAATTGQVPISLLHRWERALEDPTLWQFTPVPTHGRITGRAVLVAFDSEDDADTGHVRAITSWEDAKVADPADDLAAVLDECQPQTADSVLEAYAHVTADRPDPHLRRRALLASELNRLSDLQAAVASGARDLVRLRVSVLRQLEERTQHDDRLLTPPSASSPSPSAAGSSPPPSAAGSSPPPPAAGSSPPAETPETRSAPPGLLDTAANGNGSQRPTSSSGATAASGITQAIPSSELAKLWRLQGSDAAARNAGHRASSSDDPTSGDPDTPGDDHPSGRS